MYVNYEFMYMDYNFMHLRKKKHRWLGFIKYFIGVSNRHRYNSGRWEWKKRKGKKDLEINSLVSDIAAGN